MEEGAFLYSLKKEIYFEETSKGRSLPIGKTEKELKNLLSVPRTTIELIKATGIEKSAVRGILNRLCEKEEIVLIEKKPTRTVPTKIWQLV
ncbi:hypothetical protein KKE06_00830 [Candidatus Micrarchaeota archaeon]|nr:hypothetical protein [Candidatus Micrarchaeota archaeon]